MRKGPPVYSRGPGLIKEENNEEGAMRTKRELGGQGAPSLLKSPQPHQGGGRQGGGQ